MQIDMKALAKKRGRNKTISVSSIEGYEPFELSLSNEEGNRIDVIGNTKAFLTLSCDRCLDDVECVIPITIDKQFSVEDDQIFDAADDTKVPLPDGILDLETVLREELTLEKPTKVLCRDDCKGLCPHCGTNLNIRDCGCNRESLDPRMAKVLDIFSEFKEVNADVDMS